MQLEKWYADYVAGNEVQIHYLAKLRLGPLLVSYRGQVGTDRMTRIKVGGTGFDMPCIDGDGLQWNRGEAEHPLTWRNVNCRPVCLWRDKQKAVIWAPMVLNDDASIQGGQVIGRGYAEKLTLNFAPWQLGMKRLKWGRFCGQSHSLTWVEWEGRIPRKVGLLNGHAEALVSADRTEIRTTHARLNIASPKEIVSESLGSGALKALGLIRTIATGTFLSGIETKWLATASLEQEGKGVDHGTVIYEEVVWQ